jgi:Acetyltransferase (GNAT) family
MELVRVETPLKVLPELREVMMRYPREYGSARGVPEVIPAEFAWHVVDDGNLLGFAWASSMTGAGMPNGLYLDLAIVERFQGRGTGKFALAATEAALREAGVPELLMQVNNTDPQTGLRVRRWLLASGYRVIARDEMFAHCSDEQYALKVPMPVYFSKQIRGGDDGTAAAG